MKKNALDRKIRRVLLLGSSWEKTNADVHSKRRIIVRYGGGKFENPQYSMEMCQISMRQIIVI